MFIARKIYNINFVNVSCSQKSDLFEMECFTVILFNLWEAKFASEWL